MRQPPEHRSGRKLVRALVFLGLSLVFHVMLAIVVLPRLMLERHFTPVDRPTPVTLLDESGPRRPSAGDSPALPSDEAPEEEPEPEEPDPMREDGQIVDVAPPAEERRPEDSDYLSEHDITVEQEMRTNRFRLESDVRAPEYSQEDALEFEDLIDLGVKAPSTGGQAGSETFDPARDGRYASLPSPYRLTNKEGLDGPVPVGHGKQRISGSPSNDLVNEKLGPAMLVNTREIVFAGYINRIKRIVSFYWNQNLDNVPSTVRLTRTRYDTEVYVVLDDQGALQSIEVTGRSGEPALDEAVVQAFRAAGPFPDPPEQLIAKDGQVYLDDMGFTVQVGGGMRAPYAGVDPRAGVQFPGILKATR